MRWAPLPLLHPTGILLSEPGPNYETNPISRKPSVVPPPPQPPQGQPKIGSASQPPTTGPPVIQHPGPAQTPTVAPPSPPTGPAPEQHEERRAVTPPPGGGAPPSGGAPPKPPVVHPPAPLHQPPPRPVVQAPPPPPAAHALPPGRAPGPPPKASPPKGPPPKPGEKQCSRLLFFSPLRRCGRFSVRRRKRRRLRVQRRSRSVPGQSTTSCTRPAGIVAVTDAQSFPRKIWKGIGAEVFRKAHRAIINKRIATLIAAVLTPTAIYKGAKLKNLLILRKLRFRIFKLVCYFYGMWCLRILLVLSSFTFLAD